MIAQNSYVYIHIGLCLRLLRRTDDTDAPEFVLAEVKKIESKLRQGNFEVTLAAMNGSADFCEMRRSLEKADKTKNISSDLANSVQKEFTNLETIVFAEALTKKLYVLPSRRFNTEYLLNEPKKLLKDGSFEKMEEIAKADFSSSCRCILFGEATAAAFHILRATESVLKSYYFHHRRQGRLEKPMWGPIVGQLRAKKRSRPPESLLNSLDLIRTAYRNPTQHPEAIYEIDGAQDLFGVCLDAIGKMTAEL